MSSLSMRDDRDDLEEVWLLEHGYDAFLGDESAEEVWNQLVPDLNERERQEREADEVLRWLEEER